MTGPTAFCGTVSGVTLTSSNSSGNRWFLNTSPIFEATGNTYQPNQPGTYSVQTTLNGCLSTMSAPVVITSAGLTGVAPIISPPGGANACNNIQLSSNFAAGH